MGDDTVAEIEAEQSMLVKSIEEARQLSARSDVLMEYARGKTPKSSGSETESA